MNAQRKEFLLAEYGAIRDEITSRVRSRRQLITASVAATIAILGYGFSSSSPDGGNTWTLASIPFILAFVIYEMLRSDAVIYQAAEFLREIESEFLHADIHLGWEST
jgi:ABC-type Na+ efflux pump permease subunit